MRVKIRDFNIYVDETILIVGFLSIIFRGIREYFENYFICYLFIIFHEFAHMFVASIFGVKTTSISIRISGLCINLNKKNRYGLKWFFIYLAGPISNVILALFFNNIPMVYTINLALSIINVFPIYPLDGYNILGVILNMVKVKSIAKLQKLIQFFAIIMLGILGLYQLILFKNPSIILMVIYIFIQGLIHGKNYNSRLYQKYYKNITKFN